MLDNQNAVVAGIKHYNYSIKSTLHSLFECNLHITLFGDIRHLLGAQAKFCENCGCLFGQWLIVDQPIPDESVNDNFVPVTRRAARTVARYTHDELVKVRMNLYYRND